MTKRLKTPSVERRLRRILRNKYNKKCRLEVKTSYY